MEAFSLLKYWRGGNALQTSSEPTSKPPNKPDFNVNGNDDVNDDGPFFDLEFSLDEDFEEEDEEEEEDKNSDDDDDDEEEEIDFTLSSASSTNNGGVCEGETLENSTASTTSLVSLVAGEATPSTGNKFPVASLLKSATKLRVFMRNNLKKTSTNSNKPSSNNAEMNVTKEKEKSETNNSAIPKKFFTVKFKIDHHETTAPIASLFTRDASSRAMSTKPSSDSDAVNAVNAREVVQRYLKKVKPLYVRVSRRRIEASSEAIPGDIPASGKGVNLPAGLRVVCKHLGKSRSGTIETESSSGKRRDDSLIQQQDGIQSAILHCKRSFNAARDSEAALLSSKCLLRESSESIQRA